MIWILIGAGALFGAWGLGFPGLILGAGFGWGLSLLLQLRDRLDRLERWTALRMAQRPSRPPATPPAAESRPPEPVRYPEEAVVDALRETSAGSEMADLYDQVSGRPTER